MHKLASVSACAIKLFVSVISASQNKLERLFQACHDTQHDNTNLNDTLHNDSQYKITQNDTQHNDN